MQSENESEPSLLGNYAKLVTLIYNAAETPELWPELFESMHAYHTLLPEQEAYTPHYNAYLKPHLDKAMKISEHTHHLEVQNRTIQHIINRLPMGIITINEKTEIIAINDRAKKILQHGEHIYIDGNTIRAHSAKKNKLLLDCIHKLTNISPNKTGAAIQFESANAYISATSIWVSNNADKQLNNQHETQITLYIASPEIQLEYNIASIQHDFKLTGAEAKLVAMLINECNNLNEVAEKLGLSIHTVRSQMKAIHAKTGTSNQVGLIKKIIACPSAIFGSEQPPLAFIPTEENHVPQQGLCIKLFDGRTLGYVEYGNPDGEPVIFCHSLIHPDTQMFHKPELQNHLPYRIISPKRPGFLGSSPSHKSYDLQDHAKDIIQLADTLGLQTFKVIAHSNGCPFATAIAHDYPERVSKLLLISPFVPPHMEETRYLNTTDKFICKVGKYLPRKLIHQVARITLKSATKHPSEFIQHNLKFFSPSERAFTSTYALHDYLKQWLDASYPYRIKAVAQDSMMRVHKWKFSLKDIHVATQIWHALDDSIVHISSVKKLAQALPHSQAHYLESGGHYIFFTHFDEISKEF